MNAISSSMALESGCGFPQKIKIQSYPWRAPTRKSISLFWAVNIADGRLVTQYEKHFNALTFQGFLATLFRRVRRNRKMLILLDNARYHHAASLKPFFRDHRRHLRMEFLPAYSPDLNPIERVWKLTRRLCTHNTYFGNSLVLLEIF